MKFWVALILVLGGAPAWATESGCVQEYRKAYIEFGRTNNIRYQDAADIYSIYFDYINGLTAIQNEDQRRMLEFVKKGLDSGSLCTQWGGPKNKIEILDDLLAEFRK